MLPANDFTFTLSLDSLRSLLECAVAEAVARYETARHLPGRLAFSEPEAVALLGLEPDQLRDRWLRGWINAFTLVGTRAYLTARHWQPPRGRPVHTQPEENPMNNSDRDVRWVNTRFLASLLQLSERTIPRLVQRGELPPPIRIGGSVRWRLDEVVDAIQGHVDQEQEASNERTTDP